MRDEIFKLFLAPQTLPSLGGDTSPLEISGCAPW